MNDNLVLRRNCYIDFKRGTFMDNGWPLSLTYSEVRLSKRLADNLGHIVTYTELIKHISLLHEGMNLDVDSKVEPIAYTLFVPVFFVSIGLNITFVGVGNQLVFILLLSLVAILTKLLGGGWGARLTGFNNHSSLAIGAGMVSRGEVALIIAASGLESGLLLPQYFTAVVIVVILTTLVTPPMLKMVFPQKKQEQHP